jgi:hypothetical protein
MRENQSGDPFLREKTDPPLADKTNQTSLLGSFLYDRIIEQNHFLGKSSLREKNLF